MSNVINLQAERDKRWPPVTPETKRLLAAAAKFLQYHEQEIDLSQLNNPQFDYLEQWER